MREHANNFACVQGANAGAMLSEYARQRGGAQPEASGGEPRGAGDSCRGHKIAAFPHSEGNDWRLSGIIS